MTDIRIVIAQRGWVFVGEWTQQGDEVILKRSHNVRRWGTKSGLGELAKKGPQKETILDEAGTVRLHRLAVIAAVDCNPEMWSKAL